MTIENFFSRGKGQSSLKLMPNKAYHTCRLHFNTSNFGNLPLLFIVISRVQVYKAINVRSSW